MLSKITIKNKAFTIVETMVAIAIVGIMATISVSGYITFSRVQNLSNLAYDIAFTVREVESYAYFVRADYDSTNSKTFDTGYGIQFGKTSNDNKKFVVFNDNFIGASRVGDYKCNNTDTLALCEDGVEFVKRFKIGRNLSIKKFCVIDEAPNPDQFYCHDFTSSLGNTIPNSMRIVFKRPDIYKAYIRADVAGKTDYNFHRAEITLMSNFGEEKTVVVSKSGQIYVR